MSCKYCTPNDNDKYSFLHDLLDETVDCGALGELTYSMMVSTDFDGDTHKKSSIIIGASIARDGGYTFDLFTDHSVIRYCPICGRDLFEKEAHPDG